jgi:preprotein translocase SecE subunit
MYKPGQGYWTRMMSAIFFGVLVAGGALWLSNQISAMNFAPDSWNYTVDNADGFDRNEQVQFLRSGTNIGSGFVRSTEGTTLILENVNMLSGENAAGVQEIQTEDGQAAEVAAFQVIAKFEKTYLQGGVAAAVLLLGAIVILWFCYSNKRFSEFLIATEGEMKKVNWSSRREVFGSTWVVIGISVIIAAILFVTDIFFRWIAASIDLIQT